MKIYICPICGEKDLGVYGEGYFCHHCDHWVIPLATPQKAKGLLDEVKGDIWGFTDSLIKPCAEEATNV